MSAQFDATSRRLFLTRTVSALTAAGLPAWFVDESVAAEQERLSLLPRRIGANDQINVGVIGPGGSKGGFRQGLGDTQSMSRKPGVKVIAVCDVDAKHRDEAADKFGPETSKYSDFRELLERKDIDAVVIGTPDHWHAVIAIAAMKAGKDVYCEKPLTLTIEEGKRIVRTWRETGAVFQTGSQQRSDGRFRMACELVRNGRLGTISKVVSHLPTGNIGGPFPVKPVPTDFNWDMWLGPAPMTDYVYERTHGSFRHWLEYSGGMLTDWGAHHNDIAQWGLGADRSGPTSVEAIGRGALIGANCYNAFVEFDVTYSYPNGVTLLCTNKGPNGVDFIGEKGTIFVSREKIEANDPKLLSEPLPADATRLYMSNDHIGNFVECVRNRKQPICDAEIGYRSVSVCHLANICLRQGGRKLQWDPAEERFVNDRDSNSLVGRQLRSPWKLG